VAWSLARGYPIPDSRGNPAHRLSAHLRRLKRMKIIRRGLERAGLAVHGWGWDRDKHTTPVVDGL
jgi:hypothetical protein